MGKTHGQKLRPKPCPFGLDAHGQTYPWVKLPGLYMLITYVAYFLYLDSENKTMIILWGEAATRFDGQAIRHLGLEKSIIMIFVGTIGYCQDGYL
jgi:hypothetical protein